MVYRVDGGGLVAFVVTSVSLPFLSALSLHSISLSRAFASGKSFVFPSMPFLTPALSSLAQAADSLVRMYG